MKKRLSPLIKSHVLGAWILCSLIFDNNLTDHD